MSEDLGQLAEAHLAQRKLARRHFFDFCQYANRHYPEARHLRLLAKKLEQVERYVASGGRQGIGRLMVFMPPRYWKSQTCSVLFPQWFLGRNPDQRIILASYAANLATGFSRKVRNGIGGLEYRAIFGELGTVDGPPREVASDSRAADEWELANPYRGGMTAAGVGGGITGKGANLLIVDDPLKDRAAAESEATRDGLWNWWTSTAFTRLEDNAAVIIVLTRWHEQDLAGRLLQQMLENGEFAQDWQVLLLAARAEQYSEEERARAPWLPERDPLGRKPGQPLWPDKQGDWELSVVEAGVGSYDWGSLYQQRPYAKTGGTFEEGWFNIIQEPPSADLVVARARCWDKAATAGGGAHTAGVLMSRLKNGRIVVEHVARGQWSTFQREEKMLEMARLDMLRPGPRTVVWHPQDPGSAGLDSARATNAKLAKEGIEGHFEPVTGSKETRAGPWSSACEAGIVDLVQAGWNRPFVLEHVSFPKGTFKDQVDAASDAYAQVGIYGVSIPMSDMPQDRNRANRWDIVGDTGELADVVTGVGPLAAMQAATERAASRWGVMRG